MAQYEKDVFGGHTHSSIPAVVSLVAFANQSLRIAWLEVLSSWWLDVDHRIVARAWGVRWTKSSSIGRWTWLAILVNGIFIDGRHIGKSEPGGNRDGI